MSGCCEVCYDAVFGCQPGPIGREDIPLTDFGNSLVMWWTQAWKAKGQLHVTIPGMQKQQLLDWVRGAKQWPPIHKLEPSRDTGNASS